MPALHSERSTRLDRLRRDRKSVIAHIRTLRADIMRSTDPDSLIETLDSYLAQLQRIDAQLSGRE